MKPQISSLLLCLPLMASAAWAETHTAIVPITAAPATTAVNPADVSAPTQDQPALAEKAEAATTLHSTAEAAASQPVSDQATVEGAAGGESADSVATAATPPTAADAGDGTAPANSGSTGWTGGTGGSVIGTNPAGAVPESKTWQPPTARGLDLQG
ncbi:MAG: hypothetical protein DI498_03765 [Paracoccus denitrificans]|nr:MAG: hypothetical protein DI498_03765 [Paracoccus denitrificans]PZO85632.1 MAG: hypothetical protein DI633_03765 [Paracoccus denitrificans]